MKIICTKKKKKKNVLFAYTDNREIYQLKNY